MFLRLALVFLSLAAALCFAQPRGQMPQIEVESLAEVAQVLPRDLPGEHTLVLMGFEFEHQKKMDTWVALMNLRADDRPWVQLHLISRPWGLISGFINARKRPYFPDALQRARVLPVYTDVTAFLAALGFADDRAKVLVAVVHRNGTVLAVAEGEYDAEKAARLRAALTPADTAKP
jgi:hypothetical protein